MTGAEGFVVDVGGAVLHGTQRPGEGPAVVFLHAGVTDRRSWTGVTDLLDPDLHLVAYDRRGYGATPASQVAFTHLDDLLAVLRQLVAGPAWLVGSSAGGSLALDAALAAPELVGGLVLLAPGVSGAPDVELDPHTLALEGPLDRAYDAGDMDEVNRLEAWLWLDGPAGPEGRVASPARDLFLDMNAVILRNPPTGDAGHGDADAWSRIEEIQVPSVVACGELDLPLMVQRAAVLGERLPNASHRLLAGVAHLPQLEQPDTVARLIREALGAR